MTDRDEAALLLVRLAEKAGKQVVPSQTLGPSLRFLHAQDKGWLDDDGWVTPSGRAALKEDEPS